jgi:energy-coupling factor transport system ATP-binding protein
MTDNLFIQGGSVKFPNISINYDEIVGLKPNERNILIGKNGSGKSILVKCISQIIPEIYSAEVSLLGAIGKLSLFDRSSLLLEKGIVGVLPQRLNEYYLGISVEEEIDIFWHNNKSDNEIKKFVYNLCEIDKIKKRQIWELSDGEQRRVAIAILLGNKNDWYILDEWNLHLDDLWTKNIGQLLDYVCKKRYSGTLELLSKGLEGICSINNLSTTIKTSDKLINYNYPDRQLKLTELLNEYSSEERNNTNMYMYHSGKLKNGSFKKRIDPIEARAGEIIAIVGNNGSGKTTLLKGVKNWKKSNLLDRPSLVLSDPALQLTGKHIDELMKKVCEGKNKNISDLVEKICQVINVDKILDPLEYSVGQIKLLSIIMAAMNEKTGILIDDIFEGLDNESALLAEQAIKFASKQKNKCIMISSPSNSFILDHYDRLIRI